MPTFIANFLLLLVAIIWGLGFIAQETAMDDIGPFQFVALRFLLAAIAVAPLAIFEIKKNSNALTSKHYLYMFLVGFIFFIAMSMQQTALLGTTVTNTGFFTGLYVLFVPLLALLIYFRRQPFYIVPCAVLAFVGIWLLGGGGIDKLTWGDGLAIACGIFWALHVLVLGESVQKFGFAVSFAVAQFAICGILALLAFFIARFFALPFEPAFSAALLKNALPEILFAALIAGGLAFTLQAVAQKYTNATVAAILLSGEALIAAIGAAILLGERLDLLGYIGCLCLLLAISSTSFFSARK